MMKKRISILIALICVLLTERAVFASEIVNHLPSETIVLNLPNAHTNWKEISRYVTEKEGLVEYIPFDQQITDWSELIWFQYFDKSLMKQEMSHSIEDTLSIIRETTLASYPGSKVIWEDIEKNKTDAIYEWILHESYKNIAPEHVISRTFLTSKGVYTIGFSLRNRGTNPVERERCIKLLRDSVSLVSTKYSRSSKQRLSILDRLKDSVYLGKAFEDWKILDTYTFETGYTAVTRVPAAFTGGYVAECLEATTVPNLHNGSMDQLFEGQKEIAQKKSSQKIEFRIYKQTDKEVIYSYVYPQDDLQVTGVVRSFFSDDKGYYIFSYKRGLSSKLNPEEIDLWKAKLEAIKIQK